MDNYDDDDEGSNADNASGQSVKDADIESSDEGEEEVSAPEEEEAASEESADNLIKHLDLLGIDNPYKELDERRAESYKHFKEKVKAGPKTVLQKAEEKKTGIERRLEDSQKRLSEMLEFGDELISNIKVAAERREYLHREFENKKKILLSREVEKETIEAMAQFDDITSRWSELGEINEPVALHEQFEEQKKSIAQLLQSKDKMIKQCQDEIDRINAKYYEDQERQAHDLTCLVERVDTQIEIMTKAYKTHLNMLMETIENERRKNDLKANEKWEKFYNSMADGEDEKFRISKEKQDYYASELAKITEKQEDITRATRIRLEKDAEMLEWELRNAKHNILMNSEKLEYNYQVLQKRNEENAIINNQQKRRVAKLSESISAMKKKIEAANIAAEANVRKMNADIEKLHYSITDLETKAERFCMNNQITFNKVWNMSFNEVKTLVMKVIEIDRILHEQQLLIPYKPPDIDLTDINTGQESSTVSSSSSSTHRSGTSHSTFRVSQWSSFRPKRRTYRLRPQEEKAREVRLLRNILRRIADRAGFLVEEKLLKLLDPYREEKKDLVKVDNIFNALRINDMKAIKSLIKYFEPYSYCPNCEGNVAPEILERIYKVKEGIKESAKDGDDVSTGTRSSFKPVKEQARPKRRPTCDNHYLIVEPTLALAALSDFTAKQAKKKSLEQAQHNDAKKSYSGAQLDTDVIKAFWQKFLTYMPPEKQKLWKTLEHGLNHYLDVLKKREALDKECSFLRRQNAELKHLFKKYKV